MDTKEPIIFSDVLYSGSLSTNENVDNMLGRFNIVTHSIQYPCDVEDHVFATVGPVMIQKLINSKQKRGLYHMVIKNPVRIQLATVNSMKTCTAMRNSFYRFQYEVFNVYLNPESQVPSGLYECSVTLKVSDPNWDIFPFLSFDSARCNKHTCAECHGELTLTVIKRVGDLTDQYVEMKKNFASLRNMIQLPESVTAFIAEFKKTFEIDEKKT